MENVASCELCGGTDWRVLIPDPRADGSHGDVVRCRHCGLMFRNRRKPAERLKKNYDSLDYEHPDQAWIESRIASFRPYLPMLEKWRGKCGIGIVEVRSPLPRANLFKPDQSQHRPPRTAGSDAISVGDSPAGAGSYLPEGGAGNVASTGRLCEVGAGHGFTLAACREAGWEVHGIEVAGGAVAYAKRELGLDLFPGTLREAKFPDGHFDAVLFWNVLDEVPHPQEELTEALRILRPGGGILVRVRNGAVHVPALRWMHAGVAVVHQYAFARRPLRTLAEKCGFCEVRIRNAHLTWTVMHGTTGTSNPFRQLFLLAVRAVSGILALVSGNRWLLAPSLLMTAEKPMIGTNLNNSG